MDPKDGTPQGDPNDPQGSDDGQEGAPSGAAPDSQESGDDDLAKAKQESRKWEQRAKKDAQALADLRKSLGQMISPEQVADKDKALAEAQADAAKSKLQAMKYRVAVAQGLPLDLAERLVGQDEDELTDDAEKLKGLVKPPTPPGRDGKKGQNGQPVEGKPDLNQMLRDRLAAR